jgi:hypothetical protein
MNYLYGDSSTSTLKSNFLEFLRDAIDFSVFVLQADAKMKDGYVRIRALSDESTAETGRLERFIRSVTTAVETGEKGDAESPTAACGKRLTALITDAHNASVEGIRQLLAEATARIEAEEAAGREACVRALGTLLAPHQPPDANTKLNVELRESPVGDRQGQSGAYDASLEATAEPGLAWTLEVGIPDDNAWSSALRIERFVSPLEIRAPQLSGWITKEVKTKPQRIERHVVTKITDDQTTLHLELRAEPGSAAGFDFDVNLAKGKVKSKRVGPADDQSVGPFDLHADDVPLVIDLATKLKATLAELEYGPNIKATFEDTDFGALPTFVTFVERLVAMMAPICREISQRSLTPNELVLRRLLGNDRREEIFVAKVTLREKLAVLPPDTRALFTPLGLEVVEKNKTPAAASEKPPVRSELPPSAPPPPVPKGPKNKSMPPPSAVPSSRTIKPPTAVPPPRNPPVDVGPIRPALDTPMLDLVEEVSSDALLEAAPESGRLLAKDTGQPRNETLVAALKKIVTLSKAGRAAEAYQEYANLFSSSAFAEYDADDQRQALKLMVLAKSHPAEDAVASAHKAALPRIKALVEGSKDPRPGDHELLGVTYLFLGDGKAANATFQAGLDLERAKNPQSELVATLAKRVSQVSAG